MKLTSTIIEALPQREITYPCLAKIRQPRATDAKDFTVLFTGLTTGTCVVGDVGRYNDDWIPANSAYWVILPEGSSVTISVRE